MTVELRNWEPISRRVSSVLCIGASAIALGELFIWIVQPAWLAPASPVYNMKANAALCVLLLGVGTWMTRDDRPALRPIVAVLGVLVLLITVPTIAEYVSGRTLNIDELMTRDISVQPGPMALQSALAMTFFAIALIAFTRAGVAARWIGHSALVLGGLMVELMTVGYFAHAHRLYDATGVARAAPQSGLAQMFVGGALAFARAGRGALPIFTGANLGSAVMRLFTPAVVLLPLVFGRMQMFGEERLGLQAEYGRTIFSVLQTSLLALTAYLFARSVNRLDERYRTERQRRTEMEQYVAICAWTRRIRWEGTWMSVEDFLERRFGLQSTHGMSDEAMAEQLALLEEDRVRNE